MYNLSLASASLSRFQHMVLSESATTASPGNGQLTEEVLGHLRSASFPSPAPTPPYSQEVSSMRFSEGFSGQKRLLGQCSPPLSNLPHPSHRDRSPSCDTDCCGGIFDCRDLIEEGADEIQNYSSMGRLSGLRSTSDTPINDTPSLRQ